MVIIFQSLCTAAFYHQRKATRRHHKRPINIALNFALSVKAGGSEAPDCSETILQDMLSDTDELKEAVSRRLLYWKRVEHEQNHLYIDNDEKGSLREEHLLIRQKELVKLLHQEYLLESSAAGASPKADNNEELEAPMPFKISKVEKRRINYLSKCTAWYRDHGVQQNIDVPIRRNVLKFKYRRSSLKLNCRSFLHKKGKHRQQQKALPTVVVLTGWGESHVKYASLIYQLFQEGFNVHTFDHRCQGLSERIRVDKPQVTDIHHFDDYVNDFLLFYNQVVSPTLSGCSDGHTTTTNNNKISLVAHSLGCIVALNGHAKLKGELIEKAVLVCPMVQPAVPFPPRITFWIASALSVVGQGKTGVYGEKFRGPWMPQTGITHCNINRSHWEIVRCMLPSIIVNTPSFRFVKEVTRSSLRLEKIIKYLTNMDCLIFTAGNDSYVCSRSTQKFIKKVEKKREKSVGAVYSSQNASAIIRHEHYPEFFHDVLNENCDMITNDKHPRRVIFEFLKSNN